MVSHDEVNSISTSGTLAKVLHEVSHPSSALSIRVSTQRSFSSQSHSETFLSGILVLRGSRSSSTDDHC